MNLGEHTQGGSTMQMGGTLIIQGTGTDMWKGYDRCRFVWTKASSNYAFSAQIKAIANINSSDITGLLVKGEDPALGPGLLFGFLGSGELFLQIRQPKNKTVIVKRSERPIRLPTYLKIIRHGKAFETCVSVDGRAWDPFAGCVLDLTSGNTIGFSVSAQVPNTLVTAKFASIRLLMPGLPNAAQTKIVWPIIGSRGRSPSNDTESYPHGGRDSVEPFCMVRNFQTSGHRISETALSRTTPSSSVTVFCPSQNEKAMLRSFIIPTPTLRTRCMISAMW